MAKEITNFYKFREDIVINTFGIKRIQKCEVLGQWTQDHDEQLDKFEIMTLNRALDWYFALADDWNEERLKMHVISSILSVADTNIPEVCKTYFEHPLHGIINNYEMTVITDCMVASSKLAGDPDKPYFFLQKFKQAQYFGHTDAQGQMLVAMLLAQQYNADDKYLYGCYVIEDSWYFTTLKGLDYCVSPRFDAAEKEDLHPIVFILRKLKDLILNR